MNKFAAGSPGAVTAHHIKWILSGRAAVEQMRQWQQTLQAEQIMDAGPKRVSPVSAFHSTESEKRGMMVIMESPEEIQMYCSDSIHIYRAVYEVHMYIYMLGYR